MIYLCPDVAQLVKKEGWGWNHHHNDLFLINNHFLAALPLPKQAGHTVAEAGGGGEPYPGTLVSQTNWYSSRQQEEEAVAHFLVPGHVKEN